MGATDSMAPSFAKFVETVCERSPLQKKAVKSFLRSTDDMFWQRAEYFSQRMLSVMKRQHIEIDYVVDAYLKMCTDILKEQIKFKRTGKYSCGSAEQANLSVYSSEKEMQSYMYGLALSQFLWPNHYGMYDFFIGESKKLPQVKSYLEVGPGHGLYLVESIRNFPEASFLAVDISPISTKISEAIVRGFVGSGKCTFEVKDVNHVDHGKYDYVVMCEVLEHLDDPKSAMIRIHDLLTEQGHLFITTCANCPAIDHVYLFRSVDEIRREIQEAGFHIVSDLPLPVDELPESEWAEQQAEINYAAMLKRD